MTDCTLHRHWHLYTNTVSSLSLSSLLFFSSPAYPQTDGAHLYNAHPDSCTHMDRTSLEFHFVFCVFAKQEQFTLSSWHHTDSDIFLNFSIIVSFGLHSLWVQSKYKWSRNDVGSSISSFLSISPAWEPFTGSNYLSHSNPGNGWQYKFRSRSTTGSAVLPPYFWPFVSWKTCPYVWAFRFGNFDNLWASSIFTWCKQILRPLLVLRILTIWIWYPCLLLQSFVMRMILVL